MALVEQSPDNLRHWLDQDTDLYADWPDQLVPPLDRFHKYWKGLPLAGCGVPARASFDPLDLTPLLPRAIVIDAVDGDTPRESTRFRYRLAGTDHYAHLGFEISGRWMDEVHTPEIMAIVNSLYTRILDQKRPHFWRCHEVRSSPTANVSIKCNRYERLLAPFTKHDEKPDQLIGFFHWYDTAGG